MSACVRACRVGLGERETGCGAGDPADGHRTDSAGRLAGRKEWCRLLAEDLTVTDRISSIGGYRPVPGRTHRERIRSPRPPHSGSRPA